MLYLSTAFLNLEPANQPEPPAPNFFLYTDYFPWQSSNFLDTRTIHYDTRTRVFLKTFEELPRLDLPLAPEIINFPEGSSATGRVLFLEIDVHSDALGDISYPLIYVFAENEAFCARKLLPLNAQISHIVHVRYGGGCGGGGNSTGIWLLDVMNRLNCKVFISDEQYSMQPGDEAALRLYPELSGIPPQLNRIRTIEGQRWSGHGDVSWFLVG
jgi:hypothetical protein